jgi:hypothetical protein
MRMAAAELLKLALQLRDWFGNRRSSLVPQYQPSLAADSTEQGQLKGVTHVCRKRTTNRKESRKAVAMQNGRAFPQEQSRVSDAERAASTPARGVVLEFATRMRQSGRKEMRLSS